MAVDQARHLNLFPQQQIISNRDMVNSNLGTGFVYNTQMGAMPENFLPIHQTMVQPKTSVNTDSGLTFNPPINDQVASRKRSRDSFNNHFTTSFSIPQKPSFVGDDVLPLVQQYQLDINSIICHHTKKIRLELEEQQKQQARMLVAAIGEKVMKKMNEKDEQIQRIGKINLVLQERVKSLYMENQLWRDLAQTNEATANSLRNNLEQVLAHVSDANERLSAETRVAAAAAEEDVESCCGSSDHDGGEENEEVRMLARRDAQDKDDGKSKSNRMCRRCGQRESCVLLLPCRHLCLCTVCGSSLHHACPVCNSKMNATVRVNMSS
ncbi:BOI-related E3 ubiquitin-protein ligase 1-like [Lycium ferocissimum]|uniref:BOI-related E3 ubiquitin-protein ligase 1-like n=1 Tax=Lycium ferocissimum TaxID=112874 RepID=UPI0028166EC8|nr:BOI-related E3 ubiquitin-protein ligase 1-like [Lycium ferocissimum]